MSRTNILTAVLGFTAAFAGCAILLNLPHMIFG
jgi:hypothetical protein